MAALSTAHTAALAALIDRCPDPVLARLIQAVPSFGGAKAAELAGMLADQARDRRRRAIVFAPLAPLFGPRPDGVEGLSFPRAILARLWACAVPGAEALLGLLDDEDDPATVDRVADRLCRAAAARVRDDPEAVWPVALDPENREGGLAELAGCLDLAPLARVGVRQLPEWLHAVGADQAPLRLLLKDAAGVAPDGATRMIEILFAHLGDAPAILRIVTQSSRAAAREEFLEGSELADFVARIVRAVKARTEAAAAFDPEGGAAAVAATVEHLRWSSDALTQLDISLERDPDGTWTRETRAARVALAGRISAWVKAGDQAIRVAAPRVRARLGGRVSRQAADVNADVDPMDVTRAGVWAALLTALRGPAAVFGCEGDRKTCVEALTAELADWADEAIHAINGGDALDEARALDRVGRVADLLSGLQASDLARTVRRRLAVAGAEPGASSAA